MKRCARLLVGFGTVLLASIGCSQNNDFVPDSCPLGERRCHGGLLEECVSHLVVNEWELYRDCTASGQVCTSDGAICVAAGVSPPCCH
jgi:hypothetical protein